MSQSIRLMLVGGQEQELDDLATELSHNDYDVECFYAAPKALDRLAKANGNAPDLLIVSSSVSDGIDGLTFIRRAQSNHNCTLPVVFIVDDLEGGIKSAIRKLGYAVSFVEGYDPVAVQEELTILLHKSYLQTKLTEISSTLCEMKTSSKEDREAFCKEKSDILTLDFDEKLKDKTSAYGMYSTFHKSWITKVFYFIIALILSAFVYVGNEAYCAAQSNGLKIVEISTTQRIVVETLRELKEHKLMSVHKSPLSTF